jgi:hypothetical protein
MKCVIMQPAYLPWAGYFNLIAESDIFVFYDNAQYQKSGWGNRNRLMVEEKVQWISVPVNHSLRFSFRETKTANRSAWPRKHYNLIAQSYAKHPFSDDLKPILEFLQKTEAATLADLNIEMTRMIAKHLGTEADFKFAHKIPISGERTERLVHICDYLKCDEYLSPQGSMEYLMQDGDFDKSQVRLSFQDYVPKPYPQKNSPSEFISHLSIVDVIANLGWDQSSLYIENKYSMAQNDGEGK